jgi:hypothetical protein
MVFFSIVSSVAVESIDPQVPHRLNDGRYKPGGIVAGPQAYLGRGDQMGGMVTDDGHLGKTAKTFHAALASQEVTADVVALQTGGINRGFRVVVDQAVFPGSAKDNR